MWACAPRSGSRHPHGLPVRRLPGLLRLCAEPGSMHPVAVSVRQLAHSAAWVV